MKIPSIAIVLRGTPDKQGRKRLFLRHSYNYQTQYISLGWVLDPKDWDEKRRAVKRHAALGGQSVSMLNQWLSQQEAKAHQILLESMTSGEVFNFEAFRGKFLGEKQFVGIHQHGLDILQEDVTAQKITASTFSSYRAALNSFLAFSGKDTDVRALTSAQIDSWRQSLFARNANLPEQYTRNLLAVYRRVCRKLKIKSSDELFADFELKIERLSQKKTLTTDEYERLYAHLVSTESKAEQEVLRRFLLMCRGLRFSDTNGIQTHHLKSVKTDNGEAFYISKPAQKTGIAGIVPLDERDIKHLVRWDEKGFLFSKISGNSYRESLKKLSTKIIGRPITTHYGRHFAGDQIINTEGMDRDDAQLILGINSEAVSRIYATRKVAAVLGKFNRAVADKSKQGE